ncbi:Kinase [Hexamita inflata]|uniref:CAMK CAMKL n=1 Tax=Hexamita inflata TaxID=28002 RepID=A0AA86TVJ8_9EUKA|nr:CAMK CAMKL [Hexamita inflata]
MKIEYMNKELTIGQQYTNIVYVCKGSNLYCLKATHKIWGQCALLIANSAHEFQNRLNLNKKLENIGNVQQIFEFSKLEIDASAKEYIQTYYANIFGDSSYLLSTKYYTCNIIQHLKTLQTQLQKVDCFKQLLLAVKKIHDLNIYHMDLKPSNLFVDNGAIILIDFGISVAVSTLEYVDNRSAYVPLSDICSGSINCAKFDVYCLGAMLMEMLTTQTPNSPISLYSQQHKQLAQLLNVSAADLLQGMLEPDQNKRYSISECLVHPFVLNQSEEEFFQFKLTKHFKIDHKFQTEMNKLSQENLQKAALEAQNPDLNAFYYFLETMEQEPESSSCLVSNLINTEVEEKKIQYTMGKIKGFSSAILLSAIQTCNFDLEDLDISD